MSKIIRTFAVAKVLATALCMAVPRKGVCADTRGWDCRHIFKAFTKRLFLTSWNVGSFKLGFRKQVVVDAHGCLYTCA